MNLRREGMQPKRRTNPKSVSNYKDYRNDLRADFKECCGYCGDWDYYRSTFYEIDHFVPQRLLKTISPNDYSNLVYSCRNCNNSKRGNFPTENEFIYNDGKIGFIDPCDEEYDKQFRRADDGTIVPLTELGRWMYTQMKLSDPCHKIIYNLTRLRERILKLQELRHKDPDNGVISNLLNDLNEMYHEFEDELRK